jgi:hypothetical protein
MLRSINETNIDVVSEPEFMGVLGSLSTISGGGTLICGVEEAKSGVASEEATI